MGRDLDVAPTAPQRRLLRALADGQELVLEGGHAVLLQSRERPRQGTIEALCRRKWITPVGHPLLDPPTRITPRGHAALSL